MDCVSGRSPERGGRGRLAAGKEGPRRVSLGQEVMVGGTRPSGPAAPPQGPVKAQPPRRATLRLGAPKPLASVSISHA